jgi:serine/threonine protein kinase
MLDHFKQGKCMLDWNNEESNGSHDSDNTDDDDDKPSGDDSDGNSPDQSSDSDSHNSPSSKHSGGGDYGGGDGDSGTGNPPLQGGFFQFQLSDLNGCTNATDLQRSLKPQSSQRSKQASSAAPELPNSNAPHGPIPTEQCSLHGSSSSTETSDKTALGRDVLAEPVAPHEVTQPTTRGGAKSPSIKHHFWKRAHITIGGTDATQLQALPDSSKGASYTHHSDSSVDAAARLRLRSADSPSGLPQVLETLPELNPVDCTVISSRSTSSTDANSKQSGEPLLVTTSASISQSFLSVKLLGAGGFSTVDEVLHRETNLRVGRKTLKNRSRSAAEELRKEVSVLQKLRHPHIIRFLGAYSKGDKMSILLSPVAETTLALWLEKSALQRPTGLIETMLKMFGCLVSSVRYLHEQRPVVIHMDIKPQNILITQGDQESPHVVLSDFGTSSSDDSDGQRKPLTRRYIAPEAFDGFTRKQAADIWSLGCVFSEMAAVSFGQSNMKWIDFRQEYSGRTGKHYWQDLPGLQDRLSSFLDDAATHTERTVVHELRSMLSPVPAERPDAASLSLKFVPAPCCLNWPNDQAIFPGPDEELSNAEMLVHEDGVDCRTQHVHVTDAGKSEQGLFDDAKLWLEDCSHAHDVCQQTVSAAKALPTRLVDLRPDGTEGLSVRIVNGASIQQSPSAVEYVALSHAWTQTQVTLTSERFAAMQEGLPRETLPKQVESAIQAAQHLGYRYMWLDSLCVLQDSDTDKRYECANMATVYRNAALTIVLDQLDRQASSIQTHSDTGHRPLSQTADASGGIDFASSGFNWNTGAWVLQERLLSRRFLHIGPEQMYWECNALKASSTFPRGLSPLLWEKVHSKASASAPCHDDTNAKNAATPALDPTQRHGNIRRRHCQWMKKYGDGVRDSICTSIDAVHATCGCVDESSSTSERQDRTEQCQSAADTQCGSTLSAKMFSASDIKERVTVEKIGDAMV